MIVSRLVLTVAITLASQLPGSPVRVTIQDENKTEAVEAVLPIDPTPHIRIGMGQNETFGLSVDGKRLTFSTDGGSVQTMVKIDEQVYIFGDLNQGRWIDLRKPLGKGPQGQQRLGNYSTWECRKIRFTQVLEIVASRPTKNVITGKRRLDVCRATYIIENKDTNPRNVGIRVGHDMYLVDNDGCLFAAPTVPNRVLNGYMLQGKELPEWVKVLQRPDLKNPLYTAHFTFKMGSRIEAPDKVSLTGLGACFGGWDIPAMASGDTAIGIFFSPKKMVAGGKREVGYAYGEGLASNPDNEGKVSLSVAGSFEPNKQFTIAAQVDDPMPGQTLTLELPEGMERLEGKEMQSVPVLADSATSMVVWRARVLKTGKFAINVRSNTGSTNTKIITITPADRESNASPLRGPDARLDPTRPFFLTDIIIRESNRGYEIPR
jgi:hypothetical protein